MKKIRITCCLLILCLLLSACKSERKAVEQLAESEFLYAKGTSILNAAGEAVRLASGRIEVSAENLPDEAAITEILLQEKYNCITLDFQGELIDDSSLPWKLRENALEVVERAIQLCDKNKKYLLIDISEYPQTYKAWYEGADFIPGVINVWQQLAERLADEPYFGAYILSEFPRTGSSENQTALSYFEEVLQQICNGIREKDSLHLIAVGAIYPYSAAEDAYHGLPYVKDANFAYCAVIEKLNYFNRQQRSEKDGAAHLTYPNNLYHDIVDYEMMDSIIGSDLDFSSMDYQTRATPVFKADEADLFARLGVSVLPPDTNGGGELRVWEVRFVECDSEGNELKVLYDTSSTVNIPFMGVGTSGAQSEGSVYEDDGSAYLESITESTFFYVKDLNIPLEKGKYYQLTVTIKQRGMNKQFTCAPTVQMFTCESYENLNAAFLQKCCEEIFTEVKAVGVPLIYEKIDVSAAAASRGGEQYKTDLLTAIETLEQNYIE